MVRCQRTSPTIHQPYCHSIHHIIVFFYWLLKFFPYWCKKILTVLNVEKKYGVHKLTRRQRNLKLGQEMLGLMWVCESFTLTQPQVQLNIGDRFVHSIDANTLFIYLLYFSRWLYKIVRTCTIFTNFKDCFVNSPVIRQKKKSVCMEAGIL